jgi:hypothetical protein
MSATKHWFCKQKLARSFFIVVAGCCMQFTIYFRVWADDFSTLCIHRKAIEKIYYNHRLGQKPTFEKVSPESLIERLVNEDLRREAALRKVYGVEMSGPMVQAEVQRINTTTRAPEMLAEIKAALGNDMGKFADAFAKPVLVERLLRERFENDDTLHATQRREMERLREILLVERRNGSETTNLVRLLSHDHSNQVSEVTWHLERRPDKRRDANTCGEAQLKSLFGPNAQFIPSTQSEADHRLYFEDLPRDLRQLLQIQLRQAGDTSAVVEMPGGFALYVAKEKTEAVLSVACLCLPKRNFEAWFTDLEL